MSTWAVRESNAYELMDDPDCDPDALRRTYAQFSVVNAAVSGWRRIYRRYLRPLLAAQGSTTVLDIGCGGGDVGRSLLRWAARDGGGLSVTGIDPDHRAFEYASTLPAMPGLTLRQATSSDLVAEGARFDVVISNHLLHHLTEPEVGSLLRDSAALGSVLVVHNDLRRSRVAYAAYALACRPTGPPSFLRADGLLSIRRSYRPAELAPLLPADWRVERQAPYRLLVVHEPAQGAR